MRVCQKKTAPKERGGWTRELAIKQASDHGFEFVGLLPQGGAELRTHVCIGALQAFRRNGPQSLGLAMRSLLPRPDAAVARHSLDVDETAFGGLHNVRAAKPYIGLALVFVRHHLALFHCPFQDGLLPILHSRHVNESDVAGEGQECGQSRKGRPPLFQERFHGISPFTRDLASYSIYHILYICQIILDYHCLNLRPQLHSFAINPVENWYPQRIFTRSQPRPTVRSRSVRGPPKSGGFSIA